MSELKEDIRFLEEILNKVDSINLHDRLEGIQMLGDQIKHMEHRQTTDLDDPKPAVARKPTTAELWEWAAKVFSLQQGDTE